MSWVPLLPNLQKQSLDPGKDLLGTLGIFSVPKIPEAAR